MECQQYLLRDNLHGLSTISAKRKIYMESQPYLLGDILHGMSTISVKKQFTISDKRQNLHGMSTIFAKRQFTWKVNHIC